MKKYYLFVLLFIVKSVPLFAQPGSGFVKNHPLLSSGNITIDKNFYLWTAVEKSPEVQKALAANGALSEIFTSRKRLFHEHGNDNIRGLDSLLGGFLWSKEDTTRINAVLRDIYQKNSKAFDAMVNQQLRPSGYYQRFIGFSNQEFLIKAWQQCFERNNYIINVYGLGKKLRYHTIDSASYDVKGEYYTYLLKSMFNFLDEQTKGTAFYQPSLQVAIQLLDYNDRDEPAQFEPLENGENKAAAHHVSKITDWKKFTYSAILVPGEGPELLTVPLSPGGKMRCELAADRYKKGMAPFIIVSGGNCHPYHTPFNEAFEMKKFLMKRCAIPESAIIIEPQARHTTTNFRNAERLMIRYGLPMEKPALCVSTNEQTAYIEHPKFDERNRKELGYLPYRDKKLLSVHDIVFYPVIESLHVDPYDPLDP